MKRLLTSSRILLTGASSGIGASLAVELAKEGADMVILARREDRLRAVIQKIHQEFSDYGPHQGARKILSIVGDVTDTEVRQKAIKLCQKELGGLDILINNAGAGATSLFETTTEKTVRGMMELNYFALYEMTRLALPLLDESAQSSERQILKIRPMIVNLSSIVGLRGTPHYGAYGAAKFAVTGLSEAMRAELDARKIDVLLVCPGTTKTEFFDVLHQSSSAPEMPVHLAVTPDYVASRIVRAMKRGRHRIIPYFQAQILDVMNRFFPRMTDWIMTKFVGDTSES